MVGSETTPITSNNVTTPAALTFLPCDSHASSLMEYLVLRSLTNYTAIFTTTSPIQPFLT